MQNATQDSKCLDTTSGTEYDNTPHNFEYFLNIMCKYQFAIDKEWLHLTGLVGKYFTTMYAEIMKLAFDYCVDYPIYVLQRCKGNDNSARHDAYSKVIYDKHCHEKQFWPIVNYTMQSFTRALVDQLYYEICLLRVGDHYQSSHFHGFSNVLEQFKKDGIVTDKIIAGLLNMTTGERYRFTFSLPIDDEKVAYWKTKIENSDYTDVSRMLGGNTYEKLRRKEFNNERISDYASLDSVVEVDDDEESEDSDTEDIAPFVLEMRKFLAISQTSSEMPSDSRKLIQQLRGIIKKIYGQDYTLALEASLEAEDSNYDELVGKYAAFKKKFPEISDILKPNVATAGNVVEETKQVAKKIQPFPMGVKLGFTDVQSRDFPYFLRTMLLYNKLICSDTHLEDSLRSDDNYTRVYQNEYVRRMTNSIIEEYTKVSDTDCSETRHLTHSYLILDMIMKKIVSGCSEMNRYLAMFKTVYDRYVDEKQFWVNVNYAHHSIGQLLVNDYFDRPPCYASVSDEKKFTYTPERFDDLCCMYKGNGAMTLIMTLPFTAIDEQSIRTAQLQNINTYQNCSVWSKNRAAAMMKYRKAAMIYDCNSRRNLRDYDDNLVAPHPYIFIKRP